MSKGARRCATDTFQGPVPRGPWPAGPSSVIRHLPTQGSIHGRILINSLPAIYRGRQVTHLPRPPQPSASVNNRELCSFPDSPLPSGSRRDGQSGRAGAPLPADARLPRYTPTSKRKTCTRGALRRYSWLGPRTHPSWPWPVSLAPRTRSQRSGCRTSGRPESWPPLQTAACSGCLQDLAAGPSRPPP